MKETKPLLSENLYASPVIHCKTISRNQVNGTDAERTMGLNVSIAHSEKLTIEEMAAETQHTTTATTADVYVVWESMKRQMIQALAQGKRIDLGEFGTLSVDVRTKTPKRAGDTIRANEVEIGRCIFKPGMALKAQLGKVHFKVDNTTGVLLDTQAIEEALTAFFSEHKVISCREFAGITHYSLTSARKMLKQYVAEGRMERVPYSNSRYCPAKGYFGW